MRLKELELANFKVFGESVKIPIRPITLIFGPNSSGKSSIIQSLLLMKQSATAESIEGNAVQFRGSLADLGSYVEIVHGRDPSKSITLGVTLDLSDETTALEEFSSRTSLQITNPTVSLKTNFVSGSHPREGTVGSIEASIDDDRIIFESVHESTGASTSTSADSFRSLRPPVTPNALRISEVSTDSFLYEEVVQPLVATAVVKLTEQIEKLRKDYEAAPNKVAKPTRVGRSRVFAVGISKSDISKEISSYEGLLSMLSAYDYDSFQRDLAFAGKKVFVGLRGCMLDRSQVVDKGSDILYPSFQRAGKSSSHEQKFKELLSDEFFKEWYFVEDVEDAVREWEDVFTEKYFLLTHIWLLDLILLSSEIYRKFLYQLLYIGPMRQFPSRYYLTEGIVGESVGKTGELSPTLLLQKPQLVSAVNSWLNRLKVDYEFDVARLAARDSTFDESVFSIRIRNKSKEISSSLVDVGFGISQLLPVLLQCILSENSTVCIEQPELHLHPALQAELGDLFLESALGDQKNTFILETHSEHLILRILKRIRQTSAGALPPGVFPVTPDQVQIVYLRPTDKSTELHCIGITDEGDFSEKWPDGFFPERGEELFE